MSESGPVTEEGVPGSQQEGHDQQEQQGPSKKRRGMDVIEMEKAASRPDT